MSEFEKAAEGWRLEQTSYIDAEILCQLKLHDPDAAKFLLEMADILIYEMGWDQDDASIYILDWAAHTLFDYED